MRRLLKSFSHAWRGLSYAFKSEANFRLQVIVLIFVLLAGLAVGFSSQDYILVVLVAMLVLVLEMLNTFVEKFLDLLSPRLHHQVGLLKDILAGAVLVAAMGAAMVGFILFGRHFF